MSESQRSIEEVVESFLEQRRAGVELDADEFASRHPHLLPEVRDALQAAASLERLGSAIEGEFARSRPSRIGPYRIEREIGRGGMGVVFEALEEPLGRRVALKLLPPSMLSSPEARARFKREAMLASRLEHPGACTVYGAGVTDGEPWIAMRYVEGTPLAVMIRNARELGERCVDLPGARDGAGPRAVAACAARVARALEYAHAQGVLHRDVKPSNIVVAQNGEPVLLDFGLAIEPESDAPAVTRTGETAGTPAYLAPELLAGERARPEERCDVYSLGVTLFECLTLEPPFSAPTRESLYRAILAGAAADVRRVNPDVPRDLAVIVATALERDPARRYASASVFASDLEAFVAGRPIAARPIGAVGRALRWAKREPMKALLGGTLTAAALALMLVAGMLIASRDDVRAGQAAQLAKVIDAEIFEAFLDLSEKRAERAETRFVRVLEMEPENADAKVGRLLALLRMQRREQAAELLRDAPRSQAFERLRALASETVPPPDDPEWLARASAFELFVDGEGMRLEGERRAPSERVAWMQRALPRFDEAVIRAPQARALYHQMRAFTAADARDERAARSASSALVALWPDSARAWFQAGSALTNFDPREALALLERAAELDSQHAPTFQNIGTAYMNLGEWEQALRPLQRSIELNPTSVEAHNALGSAWAGMGCVDDALLAFERAMATNPRAIRPWANLCRYAPDAERTAYAAERVLELDPGQTMYRAIYASALTQLGEQQRACDQFAICAADAPRNVMYWTAYAERLIEIGQAETALHAAAIARSIDPGANVGEVEERARYELGLDE